MAGGINKVMLIGNLGQDPEVRFMTNGTAFTNFSVATTESWRDKTSGEQKELTEWHRVVLYRKLAEIAGEYLKKGAKVYIEGSLRTRKWQDKEGVERYTTEIQGNNMQMLDKRAGEFSVAKEAPNRSQPTEDNGYSPESAVDFDDSIPF